MKCRGGCGADVYPMRSPNETGAALYCGACLSNQLGLTMNTTSNDGNQHGRELRGVPGAPRRQEAGTRDQSLFVHMWPLSDPSR